MLARLRRDNAGANAVEFALVLPILLVLLFGMLWGGIALNQKLTITQAAREGARFGATLPFVGAEPDDAWFDAIADRMRDAATGGLEGDAAFCVRLANPDGTNIHRFYPNAGTPLAVEIAAVYEDPTNPSDECVVEGSSGPTANRARVEVVTATRVHLDLIFFDLSRIVFSDSVARFEPEIDD